MLTALGNMLQQTITLASLSAGVLAYSPLLFLLMATAVIPAFLGESNFAFLSYALAYSVLTPACGGSWTIFAISALKRRTPRSCQKFSA